MKSITPVISVILLIMLTIVASIGAYAFINSSVNELESSGAIEESPYTDNSRLNLVSITGSQALVRNDGSSPVTEMVILINGNLLNYTLDTPIQPGEIREINYTSQLAGRDLEIKIIYNAAKTVQDTRPASQNIEGSGFNIPDVFYNACQAGATIVNWNNTLTFMQNDSMTCGCNLTNPVNAIINPGFEQGINNWTENTLNSGNYSIGESIVFAGDYSLYLEASNPAPQDAVLIGQNFSKIGNISLYANGSLGETWGFYGFAVIDGGGFASEFNTIYYAINQVGLDAYCIDNPHPEANIFVRCLQGYDENAWENVTVNFKEDFLTGFNEFSGENIYFYLMVQGEASAYYDSVSLFESPEGKYCETGNVYGLANGVCYQGECVKTFPDYLESNNEFLFNENSKIIYSLKNFNDSAKCSISFDGESHEMEVSSSNASYTFSEGYSKGNYLANLTCNNDAYISKSFNLTFGLAKLNSSLSLDFDIKDEPEDTYQAVGEINSDYPGKEILVILREEETINIYSSNLEYIGNISVNNNQLIDATICEDQRIGNLLIADVDLDGENEIIVKDCNYIYLFNSSLQRVWSYYYSFFDGGMAVADISEDNGLEILANSFCDLMVLNRTGDLVWSFDAGVGGCGTYYKSALQSPVVADITPENSGLEILTVDHNTALVMLDALGNQLNSFMLSSAVSTYISPSVAEIDSTSQGLEVVYIANDSETNMSIYLLNSTLGIMWNYSFYWNEDGIVPKHIAIGDVTGNGNNEIVVSFVNNSGSDIELNDYIIVLNKDGGLLTEYITAADEGFNPILAEIDSANSGLEIISPEAKIFKIINYQGSVLYQKPRISSSGPIVLAEDLFNNGLLELISFESGVNRITIYNTGVYAENNIWPMYKHDLNQTGYQD